MECFGPGTGLSECFALIEKLERLKTVRRRNATLDAGRPENSAEHSWHAAMMALILSSCAGEGVDIARVIKMLLVHDLGEIDAGDSFLYDEEARKRSGALEEKAVTDLFADLPSDVREELSGLWREFEARTTPDAKFAAAMDALQPLVNHFLTADENQNPDALTQDMVMGKKSFISEVSPELFKAVEFYLQKSVSRGLYFPSTGNE